MLVLARCRLHRFLQYHCVLEQQPCFLSGATHHVRPFVTFRKHSKSQLKLWTNLRQFQSNPNLLLLKSLSLSSKQLLPDIQKQSDNLSPDGMENLRPPAMEADPLAELDTTIVEHLHEGILWFSNLFPVQHGVWDIRHIVYRKQDVTKTLERLIDKMQSKHAIEIREIIPKPEEGGIFVYFASSTFDAKEAAEIITNHLKKRRPKSLLVKEPIRASLVKGKPFIHDMVSFPSKRVAVTFRGAPLPMEELYSVLRPYGQLLSLEYTSSGSSPVYATPFSISDGVKSSYESYSAKSSLTSNTPHSNSFESQTAAIATYNKVHGAIGARNCAHGTLVHGTRLNIRYVEQIRSSAFWDFFSRNSRVFLPLFVSLLFFIIYHLFDPIRVFNVQNQISGRFMLRRWSALSSVQQHHVSAQANSDEQVHGEAVTSGVWKIGILSNEPTEENTSDSQTTWLHHVENTFMSAISSLSTLAEKVNAVFSARYESVPPAWSEQAEASLLSATMRETTSFILLAGPNGCGKTTMAKRLLQYFPHRLEVNFRKSQTLSSDDQLLEHLKRSVGYSPALTTIHTLRQAFEQVIAMSTRGVISPQTSLASHTKQVLECVTQALIRLERSRSEKFRDGESSTAHPPLLVLNGFDTVFVRDHEAFSQQLLQWARAVTVAQLATVVILCDVNVAQELEDETRVSGAVPEVILLDDADKEHSIALLRGELRDKECSQAHLAHAADVLGGRLSDLRSLVIRASSSGDTNEALEFVVAGAMSQLLNGALGLGNSNTLPWSRAQVWYVLKTLYRHPETRYDDLLFSPLFEGDEAPLRAMQRAEIITVWRDRYGRHHAMFARPVLREATGRLLEETALLRGLERAVISQIQALHSTRIEQLEQELVLLDGIRSVSVNRRLRSVASHIETISREMDTLDQELGQL